MKTNVNIRTKVAPAISVVAILLLLYTGCDGFLEREPTSSLSAGIFYETEEDAISALNAAYASLQSTSLYSEMYPKVIEVASDDISLHNTPGLYFDDYTYSPAASGIERIWTKLYEGVFRSNLVLTHVPGIEMPEDLKSRILGEARFLRALYYWHLTMQFGEVPLIQEATPDNPAAAEKPKSPISEIYAFMIQDLEQAAAALPVSYDASNAGRATKGAALSLLGKTYLYAENYPEAEAAFNQVIDAGWYDLVPDYADVFLESNEHNEEIIFAVQFHDTGGGVWGSLDTPTSNESTLRDRLNLPEGGGGFGNLIPTQDIVDAFEEDDPRLEYSIWQEGDAFGDEMYDPEWSATGYSLRKAMVPVKPFDPHVGTNWPLIRFADVLLMYAEAANENGRLQAALEAVNRVRVRADMPPLPTGEYPVSNEQELFEAIVHERRVELCFEIHRFNDLRRWGLAVDELARLGYEPKNRYLPIPQAELDVNEALEQNPDWR